MPREKSDPRTGSERPRAGLGAGAPGAPQQPIPGAPGAKDQQQSGARAPAARERCRPPCARPTRLSIGTTLGNGYLGSRIDEERSEMRYLV